MAPRTAFRRRLQFRLFQRHRTDVLAFTILALVPFPKRVELIQRRFDQLRAGRPNPPLKIAAAIGLGVAAGANAGLQYVERDVHKAEQDQIVRAAGPLNPGTVGHWSVSHKIPIEADEHGDVVVTRVVGTSDFNCKEIIFSVDTVEKTGPHRAFYTAAVCQDGQTWKWASAEPATARWGSLQ